MKHILVCVLLFAPLVAALTLTNEFKDLECDEDDRSVVLPGDGDG